MNNLIAKADTLLEALPYMQRFRGETFVIKYGGSFMDSTDSTVRSSVARAPLRGLKARRVHARPDTSSLREGAWETDAVPRHCLIDQLSLIHI